ncbi:MAG TPA: solute carrier family 23 protein [Syntrophales bacterium]|nr:solute carrier family 23 protein [Syntrophales bacterium]
MEFRYGLDDRPPPLEWLFLGLQWFAVAVPSIIILGKIICTVGPAGACDPLVYLQKMFFLAALFMLIQIFLGHGLPLIVGPSTVILIGILSSPGAQPSALHTAILLGGLALFVLAWTGLFGKIRRLFTRRVVAVVLLLIAFTLTPTIIRLVTGSGGAPRSNVLFAFVLCFSMIVLHRFLGGIWRSTLILSATVAGTLAWHVLGLGSAGAGSAGSGALFGLFFTGFTTALSFDPGLLAAFLICYVALAVNDIGSIESMNAFVGDGDKGVRLRRGIAVTGLANLAAGFLGIIGQVNYSLSPGVVASSRCLSRFAIVPAALLMLAVAFSPASIAVMEAVPSVVVGSAMLYILCAQMAAGIMVLMEDERGAGFNGGLVVGIPLLVAVVVAFLPGEVVSSYPALIRPVAGNSFVMGVLAVLFLEHILFRQAQSTKEGA